MLLKNHHLPKNYLCMNFHVKVYFLHQIYLKILKYFAEENNLWSLEDFPTFKIILLKDCTSTHSRNQNASQKLWQL